jgi:hypothetical protein
MSFPGVGRIRRAVARLARRWAQRLDPVTLQPSEPESVPVGAIRFEVLRDSRVLYSGPSGARARDKYLHMVRDRQPGRIELLMDGVVRCSTEVAR